MPFSLTILKIAQKKKSEGKKLSEQEKEHLKVWARAEAEASQ